MKIKQTLMEDPVDCLVSDSLKLDLKDICRGQRHITNGDWIFALESVEGMKAVMRALKPYIPNECNRGKAYLEVVKIFSRSKSLK